MTRSAGRLAVAALGAALSLASPALAQPSFTVRGNESCPSADAVRAALQTLRADDKWPSQAVVIDVAADRMWLTFGDGPSARRELPADADCATRAQTVALVVAAWNGELPDRPTDTPRLTLTRTAPAALPGESSRNVVEMDVAAFYSPLWGHAPGAWLDVGRTPRDGGLGARVMAAYQSARDVALEGGTSGISRLLVGASATYGIRRDHFFAAGDVGLLGTMTYAQGAGYAMNHAASATNFGATAEVRAGPRLGRLQLWSNARVVRLVHSEAVVIQSSSPSVGDRAVLSAWDLQLGVGIGLRFE